MSNPRRGWLKKGSAEAKAYMARIRGMKGKVGRAKRFLAIPLKARRGSSESMSSVRRRRRAATLPLAPILGLIAGVIEPVTWAISGYPDPVTACRKAVGKLIENYTGVTGIVEVGYPRGWSWEGLQRGLIPLVAGLLVHKFVGGAPLNFNRTLARARVPWVRI